MNAQELKNQIEQGDDILLLDVREAEEFAVGDGISGSQNIPMGKALLEAASGTIPKDKKIVTICRSGKRSGIVANEMKNLGYDVESLDGGVMNWNQA